ncbi:MAG: hypothetical protein ACJA13_000267 [Paraglaciecola sp.]|jgi:hypothetical protein
MKNVFIHIPKTAGNSVRKGLINSDVNYEDLGHSNKKNNEYFSDQGVFTFCFVRNPASRLKSAFFHLLEFNEDVDFDSLSQFNKKRFLLKKEYGEDFERFVLDRGFEKFNIAHFFPQTVWTHSKDGKASFIGSLETLDESWAELGFILNIELEPLKKLNQTKSKHYSTNNTELTMEMLDVIKVFYKNDYDLLGYN